MSKLYEKKVVIEVPLTKTEIRKVFKIGKMNMTKHF